MQVTKCDICKKEIKEDKGSFYVSKRMSFDRFEFCQKCGEPIEKFLKSKKLIVSANKVGTRHK